MYFTIKYLPLLLQVCVWKLTQLSVNITVYHSQYKSVAMIVHMIFNSWMSALSLIHAILCNTVCYIVLHLLKNPRSLNCIKKGWDFIIL